MIGFSNRFDVSHIGKVNRHSFIQFSLIGGSQCFRGFESSTSRLTLELVGGSPRHGPNATKEKRASDFPPEFSTRAFFQIHRLGLARMISPRNSVRCVGGPAWVSWCSGRPWRRGTTKESLKISRTKAFDGPDSGQVVAKSAIRGGNGQAEGSFVGIWR